mmetsp:Transcript_5506/g.8505  ORF Transcript_5506/g.8505 Transcript_5506/m.8505 type:complete len:83 (+) Transcript_5506:177-425(+)
MTFMICDVYDVYDGRVPCLPLRMMLIWRWYQPMSVAWHLVLGVGASSLPGSLCNSLLGLCKDCKSAFSSRIDCIRPTEFTPE